MNAITMEKNNKILVFYIDVRIIEPDDIGDFMYKISSKTNPKLKDTTVIYIPIYGESKVECINPVYITDGELIKKNERLMAELNEHLKNQLNNE